jgi:ArsR family transcriptional regulator
MVTKLKLPQYSANDIFGFLNIPPESLFSALANVARVRCLLLLLEHGELCVCELTHVLGAAQPNISRHLGHLREAGLVIDRRVGQWIHYRINPDLPDWVHRILSDAALGATGIDPYASDSATLTAMPNRPGAERCA